MPLFRHWLVGYALLAVACLGTQASSQEATTPGDAPPLRLAARTFVPSAGVEEALQTALQQAHPDRVHFLLQIDGATTPSRIETLRMAGVELLLPLRENGWFASAARGAGLDLPFVRHASMFRPSDKLSPFLPHELDRIRGEDGRLAVNVLFHPDVSQEAMARTISVHDPAARRTGGTTWAAHLSTEALDLVASLDPVLWIEPGNPIREPLNDRTRVATRAENAQNAVIGPGTQINYDLSGEDVQVGVFDTGVDPDHDDFQGRMLRSSGSGTHGTHVGGIIGSSGLLSNVSGGGSLFQFRGMAPACGIASYSISIAESDYVEAISKYGVDVTNNSFVQSVSCNYDAGARDLDLLVTGNAGRTISIVFATGNNGTNRQYGSLVGYYSCFTSAKNTLAVASINSDNLVRSSFSSMGPTFDGRLKPDVSAPGCAASGGIYSTQPNDSYGNSCGTSMASPAATGNVALVFEKYRDVFGVDLDVNPPLPSTIKAILVQTATDLVDAGSGPNNPDTGVPVFYHEGPDYATGYGLINAEAATDLIAARTVREMRAQALQQRHLVLLVPGGLPELKVTLAWDDLPGNPAESNEVPKLVNDLDLELRDPSGTRHYPWIIPPPPHEPFDGSLTGIDPMTPGDIVPAIRGVDSVNNVEQVQVDSPAGGEWILKVFSTSVSGFQDISLAANVPLDLANLALVCNGMAPPGGRLPLTATLRNLSNLDLSIRADFSVIDCDQTEQVFRTVTGKSLTGTRTVSRGVTVRLPGGLQTDCNLTLRLVITDEDSGEVLAEETCTFQIPG